MTYRNPVAQHARIIAHDYLDATDNYGQYLADQKECQAVTAAFIAEPNFYVDTFWLLRESFEGRTFVLCDGVDPRVDGASVDIWTYSGSCISNVDPTTEVYVSKKALREQGFEIPAPLDTRQKEIDEAFRRITEAAQNR